MPVGRKQGHVMGADRFACVKCPGHVLSKHFDPRGLLAALRSGVFCEEALLGQCDKRFGRGVISSEQPVAPCGRKCRLDGWIGKNLACRERAKQGIVEARWLVGAANCGVDCEAKPAGFDVAPLEAGCELAGDRRVARIEPALGEAFREAAPIEPGIRFETDRRSKAFDGLVELTETKTHVAQICVNDRPVRRLRVGTGEQRGGLCVTILLIGEVTQQM